MIKFVQFVNSTVSKLRLYYSHVPKFLEFEIPKGAFLVFSVLNAKYLTFDSPDRNALRAFAFGIANAICKSILALMHQTSPASRLANTNYCKKNCNSATMQF